jgi:hypothetical protein
MSIITPDFNRKQMFRQRTRNAEQGGVDHGSADQSALRRGEDG